LSLLQEYQNRLEQLRTVKGYCEWCKKDSQPTVAISIFTEGGDNSIDDGPWRKEGFLYFEFVTIICKKCLLNISKIKKYLKNKKTKKVYLEIRTSKTGTIPYNQLVWGGVIPFEKSKIEEIIEKLKTD
jgi:hypothetical protein